MKAESEAKETGRVEAFSDGVFAIAITLLGFTFKVPSVAGASRISGRSIIRCCC